jgi:hypothetical protein
MKDKKQINKIPIYLGSLLVNACVPAHFIHGTQRYLLTLGATTDTCEG